MADKKKPEGSLRTIEASHEGQEVELIRIDDLNILEQPRDEFDGIDELAQSIEANGLLSPIAVARNSKRLAAEYAKLANKIWRREEGHRYSITDLHPIGGDPKRRYLILIAGECRTRAFKSLDRLEIPAFVYDDLDPHKILRIQLTENLRKRRPPLPREAQAIVGLFNLERMDRPDLSKKEFSDEVGISTEQLLIYERIFMDLPDAVRTAFEKGLIGLGITREFWQLWSKYREDPDKMLIFGGVDSFEQWLSTEMLERVIKDCHTVQETKDQLRKSFWDVVHRQSEFCLEMACGDNFLEGKLRQWGADNSTVFNRLYLVFKLFDEGKFQHLQSPFVDQQYRKLFGQVIELLRATEVHLSMVTTVQREELSRLLAKVGTQISDVEVLQSAIDLCNNVPGQKE